MPSRRKTLNVPSHIGWYIAGFVDGDGSFNVSFRRRNDYRQPWKVSLCLNVSQKDRAILAWLKRHLGCGTIRYRSDGVWFYEVNNFNAICDTIIPFFEQFSFFSEKKKKEFSKFKQIAELVKHGAHRTAEGIRRILELRKDMNAGGKRKYSDQEIMDEIAQRESSETVRLIPAKAGNDTVRTSGRPEESGRNDPAIRESQPRL